MKQEAFVIAIGVFLTVAAAIAIGGLPFGGGGGSDVLVSATTASVDTVASTTVPVSVATETTAPDGSVPGREVPPTSPTTTHSPGGSSTPTTTPNVASAGPIPTTGTTQPGDSDDPDDQLRNRNTLLVVAANASGLDAVSVSKAAELEAAGYMDVVAVDAVQPSSVSAIYSAPGLDREVFLAAADLHWDGVELLPMALAPEIESTGEFDLLVLIGSDRAAPAVQP